MGGNNHLKGTRQLHKKQHKSQNEISKENRKEELNCFRHVVLFSKLELLCMTTMIVIRTGLKKRESWKPDNVTSEVRFWRAIGALKTFYKLK